MNRHAYLILAHANPGQLRKLLEVLDDERNDIFVHISAGASFGPEEFAGSCRKAGLFFTERRLSVHWGGVSIMRAELELLETARASGQYLYYHLLSGMDLPIKSQDEIHAFFEAEPGKEFIDFWPFKQHTLNRVRYYTLFPEGAGSFWPNLANNIVKGLLMALGIKQNKDVDFRFASQWVSITDSLARYTLSKREWLEKVFSHSNTVDELFLATLVWNSEFRDKVSGKSIRCIDWTRGESVRHPWVFRKDDLEMLSGSEALFARKFDENVDSEIIDAVCSMVGGT